MSLSREAIQELQKSHLVDQVTEQLMENNKLHSDVIAVPDGVKLQNLETYNKYRDRYEYLFCTISAKDFAEYCKEFTQEGSKCFINSKLMQAHTIFDLGTREYPLHRCHSANLTLEKTAAFNSLITFVKQHHYQNRATDFIEDWTDNITCYDSAGNKMANSVAVQRLRKIDIDYIRNKGNEVSNFSETASTFEKIEAKNHDLLPAEIHFVCQPYSPLEDRCFALKLSILTGDNTPKISFRIVKYEAHMEDIVNEFKELIVNMFKDTELKTFIGE